MPGRLHIAVMLAAALAACAEPDCPAGQGKVGDRCTRLAPSQDAASDVDASDSDAGGKADADTDGSAACGTCPSERPLCNEKTGLCVACIQGENVDACAQDQFCTASGECVGCLSNNDCQQPSASVCDLLTRTCKPCEEGAAGACDHIADKNVCNAGTCVQCTRAQKDACKTPEGAPAVCDATSNTCSTAAVGGTDVCGECVSDDQCMPGRRCVQTTHNEMPVPGWGACLYTSRKRGGLRYLAWRLEVCAEAEPGAMSALACGPRGFVRQASRGAGRWPRGSNQHTFVTGVRRV